MEKMGLYREDAEENVKEHLINSYWDELATIFENIRKLSMKGIESAPLYELMDLESHHELKLSDMEKIVELLLRVWNYSYCIDGNGVVKVNWVHNENGYYYL
jgi:hypothetical protein